MSQITHRRYDFRSAPDAQPLVFCVLGGAS